MECKAQQKIKEVFNGLKDEIRLLKIDLENLNKRLQDLCSHDNIQENWYCNDDWAQKKKYSIFYECKDCGLSAYYDEESNEPKSDNFLKLENLYNERGWARLTKKR